MQYNNLINQYNDAIKEFNISLASQLKSEILANKLNYKLFRYQTCNVNNLNALQKKNIWLAHPKDFNDPFEFNCTIGNAMDNFVKNMGLLAEIPQLNELFSEKTANHTQLIDDAKHEFAICCFMEENDSILMWSHYADSHKGFCIEYSFSEEKFNQFVYPVCYLNEIIDIPFGKADFMSVMLAKSDIWSYENEWRIIFNGSEHGLHEAPQITAVYLGTEIDETNKKKIQNICSEEGYKLYQMTKVYGQYKLKATQCL